MQGRGSRGPGLRTTRLQRYRGATSFLGLAVYVCVRVLNDLIIVESGQVDLGTRLRYTSSNGSLIFAEEERAVSCFLISTIPATGKKKRNNG